MQLTIPRLNLRSLDTSPSGIVSSVTLTVIKVNYSLGTVKLIEELGYGCRRCFANGRFDLVTYQVTMENFLPEFSIT